MFDKTEKLTLSVEGMHCNHCKARVEAALKAVKGVKKAEANLESASAEVVYVPAKVQPEDIASAVTAIGFDAKLK
ncbi:MAG: heavy-metal-associated domain-containing protein [Clostridia bacterium]|nr:heavy-metal-associated domain-containing protein [Clostridia bacterium]